MKAKGNMIGIALINEIIATSAGYKKAAGIYYIRGTNNRYGKVTPMPDSFACGVWGIQIPQGPVREPDGTLTLVKPKYKHTDNYLFNS